MCFHIRFLPYAEDLLMERNIVTKAVVLKSRRWGDLHRMITLATADFGVLDAIAYGARKGKLSGRVDLFLSGVFYLYHNPVRGDYSIVDVEPLVTAEKVRNDLKRMYMASFIAELVLKMHGGDSLALFNLLDRTYSLLEEPQACPTDVVVIQFIWRLIEILGLSPDLVDCPVCDHTYTNDEILFFNTAIHAPCCRTCADVDVHGGEMALGPGARRYLVFTNGMELHQAVGVPLSEAAMQRIRLYMLRYASNIAGGGLKTLAGGLL